MSRAFVKESDRDPVPLPAGPELPEGVPNRITPAGAARYRAELAAAKAERAQSPSDRLTARIAWLERRVAGHVETPTPADPTRVVFGATVEVIDGEGRERTWQIVGVDEADPTAGRVSVLAPLAQALLGARVGDVVRARTPRGDEDLEVVSIR